MKQNGNLMFERKEYYSSLLTLYGVLLPKTTYERMSQFYLEDLSITEISENEQVSRNAVFESIKSGGEKLVGLERKLNLFQKRKDMLSRIDLILKADTIEKKDELLKRWKGETENGI